MSNLLDQTLADAGFADRGVLPILLRRIGLRASISAARSSVQALANLLDQQREPLARDRATLHEEGICLTACDEQGGIEGGTVDGAHRHALREDELLQGVKLFAQLLDRIEVGVRHGLFSGADAEDGIEPAVPAHCLSGGAK